MKNEIKTILQETFYGPEGNSSWYTEAKKESGLIGTVSRISAREASLDIDGTTIAAHTHHTMYHITVCKNTIKNVDQEKDWSISWKIKQVDEEEWNEIQKGLEREYNKLIELIEHRELSSIALTIIFANLAHSAYHLGALRQLVKRINKD